MCLNQTFKKERMWINTMPKCCSNITGINKLLKRKLFWKWKKINVSLDTLRKLYKDSLHNMMSLFTFCSVKFLFQPRVYYRLTFIIVKFLTTHHEILSEELIAEFYRYFLWMSKWYTCYRLRWWQFFRIQFWFRRCEY